MTDLERAREDMRYKKHIGGFAYKQAKATYERLLRKERRQCKELGRKRLALVEFRGRLSIVDIREKPIKGYCHMLSKDGKKLYLESYDEPTGFLPIPSNNKKGYEPARDGDGCLPTWKGARGTAQGGMSPTLLTDGNTVGVVSLEIVGMVNEGGYKRNNEVLGGGGVSPTICARDFRGPVMVLEDKGNGRKD